MSWCHPAAQTHRLPSGCSSFIRTASRSSYKSGLLCVSPENKHTESEILPAQPHMQTQLHGNVRSLSWVALNSFVLFLLQYNHDGTQTLELEQKRWDMFTWSLEQTPIPERGRPGPRQHKPAGRKWSRCSQWCWAFQKTAPSVETNPTSEKTTEDQLILFFNIIFYH